jgi:hypothetical protein
MGIVQDKFQMIAKRPPDEDSAWTTPDKARRTRADTTLPQRQSSMNRAGPEDFASSPMAGDSDVSDNVNGKSLMEGFAKLPMKSYDDMASNEHVDPFYDDVGGFVERNNYLDRG